MKTKLKQQKKKTKPKHIQFTFVSQQQETVFKTVLKHTFISFSL